MARLGTVFWPIAYGHGQAVLDQQAARSGTVSRAQQSGPRGLVRGRGLGSIEVNHSFDDVNESDTRIALSQHEIVRGTIEPSPQRQCPVSMSPPVTARNDVGGTIARHGLETTVPTE